MHWAERKRLIVLDASAALELLLLTDKGRSVADRIAPSDESLHAPHLIDLEVAQVLRRYVTRGQLDPQRAREVLDDLRDLDLNRYPHDVLLDRIWELSHNASAYDAAYLTLAEILEAPLLTTDARLAGIADTRAVIEVLWRFLGVALCSTLRRAARSCASCRAARGAGPHIRCGSDRSA
jgi:predicted nucleic acid-binding protein